jgi:hypothetical protein
MKDWHKLKSDLFNKHAYYLPECDNYTLGSPSNDYLAYFIGDFFGLLFLMIVARPLA